MKLEHLILISVVGLCIGYFGAEIYKKNHTDDQTGMDADAGTEVRRMDAPVKTFDDLLDAIEWVESKGVSNAYGDYIREYQAVGSFQIWKIYVDDVNRIAGTEYTYSDRLKRNLSRDMATVYLNHYGGTFEEMARKHNGGPKGHLKECTKPYWEKVKARMETVK